MEYKQAKQENQSFSVFQHGAQYQIVCVHIKKTVVQILTL